MTPTGAVNQILRPSPFLFSFLVQVMVASSLQAFRDAGCLPTIPEVSLEISGAGKVTHDNGRAFLFVNRLVLCSTLLPNWTPYTQII
jgi:hypothetical protein